MEIASKIKLDTSVRGGHICYTGTMVIVYIACFREAGLDKISIQLKSKV